MWWACKVHEVSDDGRMVRVTYDNGEQSKPVPADDVRHRETECQLCGIAGLCSCMNNFVTLLFLLQWRKSTQMTSSCAKFFADV